MRRILFAITIFAATAGSTIAASLGQNPPPSAQTPQVSMPQQTVPPQTIDLATAKKMAAAAEAVATSMNKHITICVMDTNGDVVLAERMDGASHNAVLSAQGKARAALVFGTSTGEITQAIQEKKPIPASVKALPTGYGGEYTFSPGGQLIMKDGKVIGAIGAGGTPADEKFSQAAIDSLSTK